MKTLTITAALAAAALLIGGPALAQDKPKANCQPSASVRGDASGAKTSAPEKIDGQVVSVDRKKGTMTVRNKDGSTHEFKGDAQTLRDYKAGDHVELTLRSQPC
jgi:hypothetical protein